MPAPDAITAEKLAKLIGTPRCPILLDVRAEKVRASNPRLVPAARPLDEAEIAPNALKSLAATLSGPAVVICAEGHRRSQGVAALLRASGVPAEYLEGGQAAWMAAGLPLLFVLPGVVAIMALSWIYVLFGEVGIVSALFCGRTGRSRRL